ncbi:hypothetical protein DICSQDRAFT_140050 [Dichomitus squalens LYAD-421 SS1]|uniref:Uncharacterized protein n=1 Tax=Dichomitus squalens (strain LYAD-421) TaxID=732165 RepID=R7SS20_DICSQ|nr:uncharacterized protein DICSQDRAFT_140050 [Dichomitus squalens LYAD-421 SS1]EJF57757.1 hypothetical protein DICSQDRAFT_140050 [Dichomitus squalens LYAD-421 SS1]
MSPPERCSQPVSSSDFSKCAGPSGASDRRYTSGYMHDLYKEGPRRWKTLRTRARSPLAPHIRPSSASSQQRKADGVHSRPH